MKLRDRLTVLDDEAACSTLVTLHAQHRHQAFGIGWALLPHMSRLLTRRPLDWARIEPRLSDQPLSVDVESGLFLYLLARATRARVVVELGTSVGVSTIYLALAARHNGGRVITTDLNENKLMHARRHVEQAGLTEWVEFRLGEAEDTLRGLDGPVHFLHNDGFPRAALPVLQMLAPLMPEGAVTLCGNAALFPADYADYVSWARDPKNGFFSSHFSMQLGGEVSIRSHRGHQADRTPE